jgi:hypothetical protein
MSPFTDEEQEALTAEINAMLPEFVKVSIDGYWPAMVVIKTKNRISLDTKGKIALKGSSLRSSKLEPAIKAYQKKCIDALLGLSDAELMTLYQNECKSLVSLVSVVPWASRKALSEKTFKSDRKNERSLREAVAGSGAVVGDRVQVYFDVHNNLKLIENYDPANPDHNLPRLLKKLFTSSKLFETVVPEFKNRTNYGLSTKAKAYNDMVRAKVLPVKEKKPTVKNSLEEITRLLISKEIHCVDAYAAEQIEVALQTALELLKPKEKMPRKKKEPSDLAKKLKTGLDEALAHELSENINDELF